MIYGYARVSTQDQDLALQIDALEQYGCDQIFTDTISGSVNARPQLDNLRAALSNGDHVVCWKLDRLFRSTIDALSQIEAWNSEGVNFTCITQQISTADDSATGKLMRTILMAFAEFERDLIRERTRAGMQAAKGRGIHVGRPKKLGIAQIKDARQKLDAGWTISQISRFFRVSRATLYRYLNEAEASR